MSSIGFNAYNHNSEPAHHVRGFMFSPTPEKVAFFPCVESNYITSSVAGRVRCQQRPQKN